MWTEEFRPRIGNKSGIVNSYATSRLAFGLTTARHWGKTDENGLINRVVGAYVVNDVWKLPDHSIWRASVAL